jgi:hypothetical protein
MVIFLLTFFVIYGGMHLYLFARIKKAIPFGAGTGIFLTIFFIVMILAPIAVRFLERHGMETAARFMSYTGYIWMGMIFLFLIVSLILDLYRLAIYAGHFAFPGGFSRVNPSPWLMLILPVVISLGANAYGYMEAKNPRIEKITMEHAIIPEDIGKIRIVQISDVHIGVMIREKRLEKIVNEIKKADPDILVSTGDLLDGQMNNLVEPMMLLKSIQPRYGKFAVTGNHEFYAGLHESIAFMQDSGFSVLRGQGTTVAGRINIIGMDDPTGLRMGLSRDVAEGQILSLFPRENFTLLLKHQPVVDVTALGRFDLQLSGHTHKGQIFPFSLITRLYFPNHSGHFMLPKQSRLYVNRGTGTWGPPIRFLAPAEITVIDLVHKKTGTQPKVEERAS